MRILLITGSFPPMRCGVGDYTACLAEALGKLEDASVAVLTSQESATVNATGKNYVVFPVIRGWRFWSFPKIAEVVRRWRPDIVHIQYPTQGYLGGEFPFLLPSLLMLFNIKLVQTWHEYYTMKNLRWYHIPKAAIPGGLIVVRPDYKAHMPPFYRWLVRYKHFRFIPNASALPRLSLTSQERLDVHERFAPLEKSLLVYFGFIYDHKGVDLLFEIAAPEKHHIVLIGPFNETDPYHKLIMERIQRDPWAGKVTVTGFLPSDEVARIFAAADAVVLPFRDGGGIWNTSLHGAAIQGTFILSTSRERHGYNAFENIYYARPDDIEDMRESLSAYAGRRNTDENIKRFADWDSIAAEHLRLYQTLLQG